ncbi:MAG: hypothetical protein ABH967_01520 [Patescibacteria group bacterium]
MNRIEKQPKVQKNLCGRASGALPKESKESVEIPLKRDKKHGF